MKYLFIVPHPDDLEISCGILVQKIVEKNEVKVVIVNSGELAGDPEVREREARDACKLFGIKDVLFLKYPQFKMPDNRWDIKEDIERIIKEFTPDVLLAPWKEDTHEDHAVLANISIVAGRSVKTIYYYPTPSSLNFVPDTIVIGTRRMLEQKVKAVKIHQTQVETGRIKPESVVSSSDYWLHNFGHHSRHSMNGVDHAEASAEVFKVYKQELFL